MAVLVVAAIGYGVQRWRHHQGPPDPVPAEIHPWFGPKTAAEALAATSVQIDGGRERLAKGQRDWLHLEILADTLVARYRLTGSYTDLAEADRLLDEAMALAEFPAGPSLSRAALSATLHKLPEAEKALARFDAQKAKPFDDEASSALALRGDIAQQRGDTLAAREAYARAALAANNAGLAMRQSALALHTGEPALARRRINAVLRGHRLTRPVLSAAALQRATIAYATGDWPTAHRWIDAAGALFPGQWLAEAMAAQQLAVEGNPDEAARRYAALAARTTAPEVMDALAHLLRLQGKGAESRTWAAKASVIWAYRLAALPTAASTHVIEHELAVGDPARALGLALEDARRRPSGPSLALLGRARLLTGDAQGAFDILRCAEQGGWRSSTLLLDKADALDALGRSSEAQAARNAARARNPHATDPASRFIWFGHD